MKFVVYQLPAGLAKMNIFSSCLFTTLNARAWCAVLLGVGYFLGSNPDKQTLLIITITILTVVAVISAVYIIEQFRFQVKSSHFSKKLVLQRRQQTSQQHQR